MRSRSGTGFLVPTLTAAALAFAVACSGSEAPGGEGGARGGAAGAGGGEPASANRADQLRIPDAQLGDLEREDLILSLPWTRGRINRDAPDSTGRTTLRSVDFSRTENVDRMTVVFDSAGGYPGYLVESSINPLPLCASADSVPMEGQGLLRVRVRNAGADEGSAGPALQQPDLANVSAVHRSCFEEGMVEWVLDVERATYYRVIQAENPPRLVVDVMQAVEADSAGGSR